MADNKKASQVERKPSPPQPVCLMHKECFEQEEWTLTYVLEHIMFLQDFMDIKTLVVQKNIKSIDQLMDMVLGSNNFTELYIEDNGNMRVINLDQISMIKQFCLFREYLNS